MTLENNYNHLRLKFAIRKAMLSTPDHEYGRASLFCRFKWASRELFDAVVAECLVEGTLTEGESSRKKVPVLVWHETASTTEVKCG
jgi:hypothetical protein